MDRRRVLSDWMKFGSCGYKLPCSALQMECRLLMCMFSLKKRLCVIFAHFAGEWEREKLYCLFCVSLSNCSNRKGSSRDIYPRASREILLTLKSEFWGASPLN